MLLIGLPLEENINIQEEIIQYKRKYNINLEIINIPDFIHLNISSCNSYDDSLNKSEKECIDLIKGFSRIKTYKFERNLCHWDTEKYACLDLEECLKMLEEDLLHIKNIYNKKKEDNMKYKKYSEKLRKRTQGDILEKDLNINLTEYEFLEEIYLVVEKDSSDFSEFICNSEMASEETLVKIEEDEKYILYKILILKTHVKDFKKECSLKGFHIKETNMPPLPFSEPDGLDLFVETHFVELYKILVHLKMLKLFIECFLRYGLPKEYAFFSCVEEKSLEKFKKISESWKSDRIIEDSDEEETGTNFAYTFIESYNEE
ncbi:V-type proton ATPase subunit C (VATC) [Vairimorpha necatrix]|uniref:V-type proton ATPase subunit C n=1 Tax=Vairimorpha necatrix TaxID=6039 RepID=A0AAX4JGB3_9MICR